MIECHSVVEDSYDNAVTNKQVIECAVFEIFSYEAKIVNKGIYRFLRCLCSFIQKHLLHYGVVSCHVLAVNAALTSVNEGVSLATPSVVAVSVFSHNVEKSSVLLLFRFILKPGSDPVALKASKLFRPQVGLV